MSLFFKKVYIFAIFIITSLSVASQENELSTTSRKALAFFHNASKCYENADLLCAVKELQRAIDADPNFIEAYQMLVDVYDMKNEKENEIDVCHKILKISADKYPLVYYYLAKSEIETGRYDSSLINANKFLQLKKYTVYQQKQIQRIIENCKFAINAIQNPVPFNPINLGPNVNSKYDEYWPSISADEQTLVFTRMIPKDEIFPISNTNRQEDFLQVCTKTINGRWPIN